MSRAPLLLVVLFLTPMLAPLGLAEVTYRADAWGVTGRPDDEFRIGDTITFTLFVRSVDETFTVNGHLHLYQIVDGSKVFRETLVTDAQTLAPGTFHNFKWPWSTSGLPASRAGEWLAEIPTPHGTQSYGFDLSRTPDITISWLKISHDPLFGVQPFRKGHVKLVEACVANVGLEETPSATVALYFRLVADPLLSGQPVHGNVALPDWRQGHVVATKAVAMDEWAYHDQCSKVTDAAGAPIDAPGYYVSFEWDASKTDSLLQGSALVTRIGLRGDVDDTIWEVDETNNDLERESTIMPWPLLP